ncbi:hypothetical protein VCHA53O466_40450 [Vibrio chagasii]|nr:hypothetical protein VCHA53O466_40450 [Vibrio chagasii]
MLVPKHIRNTNQITPSVIIYLDAGGCEERVDTYITRFIEGNYYARQSNYKV